MDRALFRELGAQQVERGTPEKPACKGSDRNANREKQVPKAAMDISVVDELPDFRRAPHARRVMPM